MDERTREKLEYGISLRESTNLIKCIAIVEFDVGLNSQDVAPNWQWVHADIPPGKVSTDGYVEEIWIASDSVFSHEEEVNGEVYSLIHPNWLVSFNNAKITGLEIDKQKPRLLPGSNLIVRYRMPK